MFANDGNQFEKENIFFYKYQTIISVVILFDNKL